MATGYALRGVASILRIAGSRALYSDKRAVQVYVQVGVCSGPAGGRGAGSLATPSSFHEYFWFRVLSGVSSCAFGLHSVLRRLWRAVIASGGSSGVVVSGVLCGERRAFDGVCVVPAACVVVV